MNEKAGAQAGEYYLRGVTEVGSGFLLKPDSTFQFFFSYGALDRQGSGTWRIKEKEIVFTRDLDGMKMLSDKEPLWVGFVLGSPGVASLANVAEAAQVMPPKTTYFYPKVPTGFTLMPLEQEIS